LTSRDFDRIQAFEIAVPFAYNSVRAVGSALHPLNLNSPSTMPARSGTGKDQSRRIFFVVNGMFGSQLAGGDVHLLHTIRAVARAGWNIEYFSGQVLERHLREWNLPGKILFTDGSGGSELRNVGLGGQIRLFWAFFRRFASTIRQLSRVTSRDVIFTATDYWFDVLPVAFSKAKLKVVVLQMQAPNLREVIFRTRADVEPTRIASLHYCISQWISLWALRFCRNKRLVIVQPLLRETALKKGYLPSEVPCIPNGVDVEAADSVPEQQKQYDAVWLGRVHRQKGIDDLMKALQFLAREIPNFRALLIGNLKGALGPRVEQMGLTQNVEFGGYVSGIEKFRRLKSARLFLMPSLHEGLPIVVGEALACGVPVVGYELPMYRPFFGSLIQYVPCFDVDKFCSTAADAIKRLRAGERLLDEAELARFKDANSWAEVERQLTELISQPE
jgi:glycosyltransferase involved in cell wall biosynthesis